MHEVSLDAFPCKVVDVPNTDADIGLDPQHHEIRKSREQRASYENRQRRLRSRFAIPKITLRQVHAKEEKIVNGFKSFDTQGEEDDVDGSVRQGLEKEVEKSIASLNQTLVRPTAGYIRVNVHNVTEKKSKPDFWDKLVALVSFPTS